MQRIMPFFVLVIGENVFEKRLFVCVCLAFDKQLEGKNGSKLPGAGLPIVLTQWALATCAPMLRMCW